MADTLTIVGKKLYFNGVALGVPGNYMNGVNHAALWGDGARYWSGRDPGSDMIAQLRDDWKAPCIRMPTDQTRWINESGYRTSVLNAIQQYHAAGFLTIVNRMIGHDQNVSRHSDSNSYVWTQQITTQLLNLGLTNIIIEPYNEPVGLTWADWKSKGQQHVDIIRNNGGRWPILLNTNNWANAGDSATQFAANCPTDPLGRICAGWHTYDWAGDSAAQAVGMSNTHPVILGEFNVHKDNRNSPGWITTNFKPNRLDAIHANGATCIPISWWWICHDDYADTGHFTQAFYNSYIHNHANVLNAVRDPNASAIRDIYRAQPASILTVGGGGGTAPGAISITTPLAISPTTITPGGTVNGTVTLQNTGDLPITVIPTIAVRPPGGTRAGGPYVYDMNPKSAVTIAPGASLPFSASTTIPVGSTLGTWTCYFTYQNTATGVWTDSPVEQDKTFVLNAASAWTPTITPTATPALQGATITWTTDQASSSRVEWGTTNSFGNTTDVFDEVTRVTSHSVPLANLTPGTLYYYRVISQNAAEQTAQSGTATFTTLTLPTIASLTPNAAVQGATATSVVVSGTGFRAGSVPELNGVALAAFNIVSASQMNVTIPTASLSTSGTKQLKVRAPEWHATNAPTLISGPAAFTVNPSTAGQGLDLTGAKLNRRLKANMGEEWVTIYSAVPTFLAGDTVYFNGAARQSEVLAPTEIRFRVLPVDTAQTPPIVRISANIDVIR